MFVSLTIGDGAEFTVFGKMTGDILAEVVGMTVGLFAAVKGIRDIIKIFSSRYWFIYRIIIK